jgi:hypothetical protein
MSFWHVKQVQCKLQSESLKYFFLCHSEFISESLTNVTLSKDSDLRQNDIPR